MSQAENKESQLEIIDKKTDDFLKTLLNIKVNDEENYESSSTEDDDMSLLSSNDSTFLPNEMNSLSSDSDASKSIKSAISKIFPSFKEKDYTLIKQKVDNLTKLINEKKPNIEENLKKEIKKLIITILQLNNESNIIDAYEPLFTKNLIVSTDVHKSEYILDIQDNSEKVIGISGVLNEDFIGKLKYLDEIIQLKEKTKDNVKNIIAEVGNTSIKDLKDLLESQNKAKEEARIKNENDKVQEKAAKKRDKENEKQAKEAAPRLADNIFEQAVKKVAENPTGGKRTFKRRRKTRINKKNKRKTNKSKQNKK